MLNIYLGSPADKAGLRPGDFLERIDGRMLQGTEDLIQSIADGEPGRAASIRIVRDGVHIDIKAVLGQRLPDRQLAAMNNRFWPGWIAGDAQSEEKWEGGAELVEVVRDSPADQADFRAGDLIVAVNGAPVADAYSLLKALDRSGAARRIAFLRGNTRMERELPAAAEDSKP